MFLGTTPKDVPDAKISAKSIGRYLKIYILPLIIDQYHYNKLNPGNSHPYGRGKKPDS